MPEDLALAEIIAQNIVNKAEFNKRALCCSGHKQESILVTRRIEPLG